MKYLKLKFLLMFFALAMAIPPAWASVITFDLSTAASTNGTKITTLQQGGVTLTFSKGNGSSDPAWYDGAVRIYSEGYLGINCQAYNITAIEFTSPNAAASNGLANWTPTDGEYEVTQTTAPSKASWTGSINYTINYVEFNVASGKRVYPSKVVVTIDDGSGGDPTPTQDRVYEKVTATGQFVVGKKYIFVHEGAKKAMGNITSGKGTPVDVVINNDGTINVNDDSGVIEFLLGGTEYNYTFALPNGNYLHYISKTDIESWNGNPDNDANSYSKWKPRAISASGSYSITCVGNTDRSIKANNTSYKFGCYTHNDGNSDNIAIYVEKDGGSTTERVATPTFDPAGGNYDTPQSVTISCETDGATIYYTTDGTDPTETSTQYTGAIEVNETTTIKAIAVASGMDNSYVASAAYTLPRFVTNLTDANGLETNVSFKYNGNAVVTYVNGTDAWIRDNDGTGGYLYRAIPSESSFANGDVLKAGWTATKDVFKGLNEFKDVSGLVKDGTATVEPEVLTQITDADVNKYVKLVNVSESEIVDGSGNAVQLYDKFGTNYTFESGKKYDVVGIVGYYNNLQLHIISITEHGEPTIAVDPTALTLKEEAQTFTVTGENLVDNVGVPNNNHVFETTYSGEADWGFVKDAQGKVNGTVTVTYTGRELKATDTFVAGTKKSWNPVEEISIPITVTYQPDIYIVGNINNAGWNFGDGNRPMSYDEATGLYTAQLTTTSLSYFMFARKPGQNYGWQGDKNRLFFGAQTDGGNWVLGTESTGNIDINGTTGNQYHPIELPNAGEYTITINPTAKTFTITKVVHQVETPVISPEGGNYNTIQTVTITCATEGAAIHYTTDGTEPTESSATYENPITVDHSMTIKAIAVADNMDNSEVAEATYTLPESVNTLAAANALEKNTEFLFTGDAVVTNHNGDYTFLRDVNATAGGGLIYQSGINLAQGVVLKKGWDAKRADYRGEKEYINAINVESSGNTADYTPFDRTGVTLSDANMNEYIKLNNVKITGKTLDEGSSKYTYTGTYGENREVVTYLLHNQFDVEGILEGKTYNVTGTVIKYGEDMEVYPTAIEIVKQNLTLGFDPASVEQFVGQDFTAPALTGVPEGETIDVTYSSNNTNVATVVDNVVTLVEGATGTATITATFAGNDYYNEASATYTITVNEKLAHGMSFSAETLNVTYGDEDYTIPTLNNPNGLTVTYESDNEDVAVVDENGDVVLGDAGKAVITAKTEGDASHNGGSVSYTINIAKAAAGLSYGEPTPEFTVYVDQDFEAPTLTNPNNLTVTYESNDEDVALVDETGDVLIGEKVGDAKITASVAESTNYLAGSASYIIHVIAKDNVTMSFDPTSVTLYVGDEFAQPTLTTNPANLTVKYSSNNEEVAMVEANTGEVVLMDKVGTATITAKYAGNDQYNANEASYTITVENRPEILIETQNLDLGTDSEGEIFVMASDLKENVNVTSSNSNFTVEPATITPEQAANGVNVTVTYTGNNPEGESTTITFSTKDGEDVKVTVTAKAETYVDIAKPTFSPAAGTYTEPKEVAIACATPGVTIEYTINGVTKTYDGPFTVGNENGNSTVTVTATASKGSKVVYNDSQASATYVINAAPAAGIEDGYYSLQNNAEEVAGKYANVAGRRTLNFVADPDDKAGTIFRIKTDPDTVGQIEMLRSQGVDLQGYANRAMAYVPKAIELVLSKLATSSLGDPETPGDGILGENGLDLILKKFYEKFDYNLYIEGTAEGGYRIYGKTPSMQHVVDFYHENTAQVEAKLPMLEGYINQVLDKIRNRIPAPYNANVVLPFSLKAVRDSIAKKNGITLIDPTEDEMGFYRQVLNNKEYVWDFAYQTAMMYVDAIKGTQTYAGLPAEYKLYVEKMEKVRPDTKYYIIERGNELDYISENNTDIINNESRTFWTLTKRENFTVNIAGEQFGCPYADGLGGYATTLYTDFGYTVPEGVTAYKVASVENGVANLEALSGVIPAQTPVLLMAKTAGDYKLMLSTEAGTPVTDNQLVGPDYLIETYEIKTQQVETLFQLAKSLLGEELYNEYIADHEHLMFKTAGTVNNKYFWGLSEDDVEKCTFNNGKDCVVRSLANGEEGVAFYDNWTVSTNKAFLVSETDKTITISTLKGDVNHDGYVNLKDVTDLIDRLLGDESHSCPYCSDVNSDDYVNIKDVSDLIDILLGSGANTHVDTPTPDPEGGDGN